MGASDKGAGRRLGDVGDLNRGDPVGPKVTAYRAAEGGATFGDGAGQGLGLVNPAGDGARVALNDKTGAAGDCVENLHG